MPVRMKDIARDLNVSVVTVSKVLRNHSDISEETRARVMQRVKELNYRPNLAARALVTGKTFSIGLVVPDLVHPFFAEVAKGLSRVLRQHGYSVMIASSEEDPALEQQEIDQLLARRVDALIIASAQVSPGYFARIDEHQIPYVLLDRNFPGTEANFVGVDDRVAGRLAVEHLIAQGCRRIAHIRGPEVSTALGRLAGYEDALAHAGVPPLPDYVVRGATADDAADASGHAAMLELLRVHPRPDAVFCYNDPIALGAMSAILEAGLRVPADIAVIGCGNVHYAGLLRVPLSSVDQRSAETGERAAQLALQLMEAGAKPRPQVVLIEPSVVARESTLRRSGG
jgi:LacI family transcriptional regulator